MIDDRLAILFDTVDHVIANRYLDSGEKRLNKKRLIPSAYRNHLLLHRSLASVLKYFGLLDAVGRRVEHPDHGRKMAERRKRLIEIVFWRISSAFYPRGSAVFISKKALRALGARFGFREIFDDALYLDLLAAFRVLGFTEGRRNGGGGLELLPPHALEPSLHTSNSRGVSSIAAPWNIKNEYDLYNSNDAKLLQFIRNSLLDSRQEHYSGWHIVCDSRGAAPIRDKADHPDRGQWQNPDVFCYRKNETADDVEIFAFEVKLKFDKEAIGAAMAYRNFANFSYVAIAEDSRTILSKRRFVAELSAAGIGIIGLGQPKNLNTWYEITPAAFRVCRTVNQLDIMRGYEQAFERRRRREANQ